MDPLNYIRVQKLPKQEESCRLQLSSFLIISCLNQGKDIDPRHEHQEVVENLFRTVGIIYFGFLINFASPP